MITVVDQQAARAALGAGLLGCPQQGCAGMLRAWSRARARRVRVPGGDLVLLRPDRARCRTCRFTHVLLPAWCLPRRAYGAEVVGAALLAAAQGAAAARIATAAGAPASTVRDWLRAVGRAGAHADRASRLGRPSGRRRGRLLAPAGPIGFGAGRSGQRPRRRGRVFHLTLARPRPERPVRAATRTTGIDYLALVAERHRRRLLHRLGLADPTGAVAAASPWETINVITGGQLLTTSPR